MSRFRQRTGIDRETVNDDGTLISLHEPPDDGPAMSFSASGPIRMKRALDLMRSEQRGGERPRSASFSPYLEASQHGKPSYDDLAQHFDVKATTITNDLHRAKVLFKPILSALF